MCRYRSIVRLVKALMLKTCHFTGTTEVPIVSLFTCSHLTPTSNAYKCKVIAIILCVIVGMRTAVFQVQLLDVQIGTFVQFVYGLLRKL